MVYIYICGGGGGGVINIGENLKYFYCEICFLLSSFILITYIKIYSLTVPSVVHVFQMK
jgi:hypothetical protein